MSLFAPSAGKHVDENRTEASRPFHLEAGETVRLVSWLVVDHAAREDGESLLPISGRGSLALRALRHHIDVLGLPDPAAEPRSWEEEKALSRSAYLGLLWQEEPPGFRHAAGWSAGLFPGHALPLLLDARDGASPDVRAEIERRASRIVERALRERGPGSLGRGDGCHIALGELPFHTGHVAASLLEMRADARARLAAREGGLWVWRPASRKHATLGPAGGHTLGQAAAECWRVLRAARLSGDLELARAGLDAARQMDLYSVPRGAQTWECPLLQPDILAAAYAVRASCEAYRLTGDERHLERARYWAWAGMAFVYLRDAEGRPAMRYNTIAVMGSTFHTHSWIGLPVVWCGLVYAYALQELAEHDGSFAWRTVAAGITRSAMLQQYAAGPHRGTYPDSWDLEKNEPRPADINPENILLNAFRLHGVSPEIRSARLERGGETLLVNSAADIVRAETADAGRSLRIELRSAPGFPAFTVIAPAPRPERIDGAGDEAASDASLADRDAGWVHDASLGGIVIRHRFTAGSERVEIRWR